MSAVPDWCPGRCTVWPWLSDPPGRASQRPWPGRRRHRRQPGWRGWKPCVTWRGRRCGRGASSDRGSSGLREGQPPRPAAATLYVRGLEGVRHGNDEVPTRCPGGWKGRGLRSGGRRSPAPPRSTRTSWLNTLLALAPRWASARLSAAPEELPWPIGLARQVARDGRASGAVRAPRRAQVAPCSDHAVGTRSTVVVSASGRHVAAAPTSCWTHRAKVRREHLDFVGHMTVDPSQVPNNVLAAAAY